MIFFCFKDDLGLTQGASIIRIIGVLGVTLVRLNPKPQTPNPRPQAMN